MAMLHAWFLVGPTAGGKTAVGQRLAERLHARVLSADAMLVYRGMDIGTAKPSDAERGEVPYWGLDCVTPDQPYSVGNYLRDLRAQAEEADGRPLVVVGGTGLYVDCLLRGLPSQPSVDPERRRALESLSRTGGLPALQAELERCAPGRLKALADPRNPRRLIRAIELAEHGAELPVRPGARPVLAGLLWDREDLDRRIARRVSAMFSGGLLDEARQLRQRYGALSETARQAIGYAEAWSVLDGASDVERAMSITRLRTRQLAKRQMTWFRHQADMRWVACRDDMTVDQMADAVQHCWEDHGPTALQL